MTGNRLISRGLWLSLLLASGVSAAQLPSDLIARIDAVMADHIERGTVPGASVVVVANGAVQHAQGFGYATLPKGAATAQTLFSLGSVSKNFVGLAVTRLIAANQLNADDAVQQHLPDVAINNPFTVPVTVRHLLNHTSGFSSYLGNRNQQETALNATALATSLRELARTPLQTEPGLRFEYSNANYQILGVLIERLTNQTFPAAMQSLVFDSLQMTRSGIGHDFEGSDAATGYRFWLRTPRAYRLGLGSALEPQGGVSSTALDMGRYLIALTGGDATTSNIYDPSWSVADPTQEEGVGYGRGWFVRDRVNGPLFYHHGLNPGFNAAIAFDPSSGVGVALMANASDGFVAGNVTLLMESVLAEVFPELEVHALDVSARWIQFLILAAIVLGIGLWVIWFAFSAKRQNSNAVTAPTITRILLPSALLLALAWLLAVALPPALQIPLVGIAMFSPDIGWLLRVLVWLAASWALVRAMVLLRRRSHTVPVT